MMTRDSPHYVFAGLFKLGFHISTTPISFRHFTQLCCCDRIRTFGKSKLVILVFYDFWIGGIVSGSRGREGPGMGHVLMDWLLDFSPTCLEFNTYWQDGKWNMARLKFRRVMLITVPVQSQSGYVLDALLVLSFVSESSISWQQHAHPTTMRKHKKTTIYPPRFCILGLCTPALFLSSHYRLSPRTSTTTSNLLHR